MLVTMLVCEPWKIVGLKLRHGQAERAIYALWGGGQLLILGMTTKLLIPMQTYTMDQS